MTCNSQEQGHAPGSSSLKNILALKGEIISDNECILVTARDSDTSDALAARKIATVTSLLALATSQAASVALVLAEECAHITLVRSFITRAGPHNALAVSRITRAA
ncbi:MAG: hypothetical protein DMF72_10875 [Acidobacteria bacterium]|nr:MAG: hypothetical protein DMF72_10875 [Acidobacteriota bacterium]